MLYDVFNQIMLGENHMTTHIKLTKEEKIRVSIWLSVLFKVNNYCAVCEEQKEKIQNPITEKDVGYYLIHGNRTTYLTPFVIEKGLLEAAIIGLSSIFSRIGFEGLGIAKNDCTNVIMVKKELIERTATKLGYMTSDDLDSYIKRVVAIRNQLVAHYDGSMADYCEEYFDKSADQEYKDNNPPEIIKMKAPYANFSDEEITELKEISIRMHEALIEFLVELDKNEQ